MNPLDRPLIEACENGNALTVEQLLQQGANPNAKGDRWPNLTAFLIAAEYGHTDIITLLIQYGANPHIRCAWEKTALHYALQNRHDTTTQYLLTQLKLDPNKKDQCGLTPLMLASANGDIKTLQLLVQHGADPNATDHDGENALHHAVKNQKHDIAQYLITELKLDPNSQDRYGITPFMIATQKGDINILKLLIQYGANPYIRDTWKKSALHYALEYQNYDIAQHLITELKLDPNSQDRYGITPFMIAASKGDITMLQLLIQLGANPHATDHRGRTALHYAAEWNRYEIAHFLITHHHLDPNSQDRQGNTPLHIALQRDYDDIAKTLIRLGANPHIPNHQGQTPTTIAREHRTRLPKPQPSSITL